MPMRCAVVLLSLAVVGCGGSPTAPTPTPVAPAPTANFHGVWLGTWTRTSCQETGGAVGVGCNAFANVAGPTQFRLTATQTATAVSGTLEIGQVLVSVSGSVSTTGTLTLRGQGRKAPANYDLSNWQSAITNGVLSGSFTLGIATDDSAAGTVSLGATFSNVPRS